METVVRAYSQFLDAQVTQSASKSAYYSTYHTQLSQIDNVLADNNAGLSPALQDFFQTVHAVAAAPYDVPSRQSMLSSAGALVARFNTLGMHFEEMRQGINTELTSEVAEINNYAQQIALLNGKIVAAQQDATQPPVTR